MLDLGIGSQSPDSALTLTEELIALKKQVKEQNKEIKRLKEENEFLEETSAFFAASRLKEELLYGRYNTKEMTVEELKILIWRYFISYWNNRRICSVTRGLPPMVKRHRYYQSLNTAA